MDNDDFMFNIARPIKKNVEHSQEVKPENKRLKYTFKFKK